MTDMNGKSTANKDRENKQNDDNPRTYDEDHNIYSAPEAELSSTGHVNMEEAIIVSDDLVLAGGFGAQDGIGSLLPVLVDSTDFEVSLLEMQDFEEPQGVKSRPGLGWTEAMEK